jgi:hypothetical protein
MTRHYFGTVGWARIRLLWGKLQQVKKGTRVKCWVCPGVRITGGCPLCGFDKFVPRDVAIRYTEFDMEMESK